MFVCHRCGLSYGSNLGRCGLDGEPLVESDLDPLIGREIDRYLILEQLGSGAMARVYRARHTFLDSENAVKILLGQIAVDRTLAERFRREAQAVSRIKHPNVVTVSDFGVTAQGVTFLAMELLRGRTMSAALRADRVFSPARARDLAVQIARGLGAAQKHGFVHRDLKPGNVMLVEEDGREVAKVLDFGLVRVEGLADDLQKLTRTGQVFGTPAYMAPEQIEGATVGPQADLYALGVILYEMLTGAPPFTGGLHLVLSMHVHEPPRPLPQFGRLGQLTLDLLAKRPEDRPADAEEVVRRLEELEVRPVTPRRGVRAEPAVYDSSPFVEIQKTFADSSINAAEPRGVLGRSMIAISQRLKATRPRTLALAGALALGAVPGAIATHFAIQALDADDREIPRVFVQALPPDREGAVGEALAIRPLDGAASDPAARRRAGEGERATGGAAGAAARGASPDVKDPEVKDPEVKDPEAEGRRGRSSEPNVEADEPRGAAAAQRTASRSTPAQRSAAASSSSSSSSARSPKALFQRLDRDLLQVLEERGLSLTDIASMEPDRVRMWGDWRRAGSAPMPLGEQTKDALASAARSFYIHKPFLKVKLGRVLTSLQAVASKRPAAAIGALENEYLGLQREVERAEGQRDFLALALRVHALEKKVARLR